MRKRKVAQLRAEIGSLLEDDKRGSFVSLGVIYDALGRNGTSPLSIA